MRRMRRCGNPLARASKPASSSFCLVTNRFKDKDWIPGHQLTSFSSSSDRRPCSLSSSSVMMEGELWLNSCSRTLYETHTFRCRRCLRETRDLNRFLSQMIPPASRRTSFGSLLVANWTTFSVSSREHVLFTMRILSFLENLWRYRRVSSISDRPNRELKRELFDVTPAYEYQKMFVRNLQTVPMLLFLL